MMLTTPAPMKTRGRRSPVADDRVVVSRRRPVGRDRAVLLRLRRPRDRLRQLDPLVRRADRLRRRQHGDGGDGDVLGRLLARPARIDLAGRSIQPGWMLAGSMTLALVSSTVLSVVNGGGVGLWIVTFLFGVSIAPQFASMISYAEAHLALSGRGDLGLHRGCGSRRAGDAVDRSVNSSTPMGRRCCRRGDPRGVRRHDRRRVVGRATWCGQRDSATAGDLDERTGDVARRRGGQPQHRFGDLVGGADALHRHQSGSFARRVPVWRGGGSRSRSARGVRR